MLVYHMVLSFMDNNDRYSSVFFLSWTIMVGIAIGFVCLGQELSVYHTLSWTILGDIFHGCVCRGKIGWYINRFCLSWTKLVGISPSFVCRGQDWLEY